MLANINLDGVKLKNRRAILKLLNNNGAMSRKDIASAVNLTSASVTQLCSEMIEENIIIEQGEAIEENRVGRKKILIDINYDIKKICSITFERYLTYITITNLKGELIVQNKINTDSEIEPNEFLKKVIGICKKLLENSNIDYSDILGIGVSVRGLVDKNTGDSIHAYGIWDEKVEIKKIIQREIPVHVIVENNMKSFAQGEITYGLGKKYKDLLFLKWYPGVGSAIVINGTVYDGRRSQVAELGHFILEPNGDRCKCGKKGCLEVSASFASMVTSVLRIYSEDATPILYKKTKGDVKKIDKCLLEYVNGDFEKIDVYIEEIIYKAVDKLALTTINAYTMLSPDKIIIYGKMFERDNIINKFIEQSSKYDATFMKTDVVKSELFKKHSYIGGVAVVVNELFFNVGGNEI